MTDERISKLASDILDLASERYERVSGNTWSRWGHDTDLGDIDEDAVQLIKEFLDESIGKIEAVPQVNWKDGCCDVMIGVDIRKRGDK